MTISEKISIITQIATELALEAATVTPLNITEAELSYIATKESRALVKMLHKSNLTIVSSNMCETIDGAGGASLLITSKII